MITATGSLTAAKRRASREGWAKWIRTEADERAVLNGCWFDVEAAEKVVDFFRTFLCHSKGDFAGQPFELLDWQRDDIVMPLFGWQRENEHGRIVRRFKIAYIEIPKKNGKSTLAAGIGLYMLAGDGEQGAEVYSAATDRNQANIVHREAVNMVDKSPELSDALKVNRSTWNIAYPGTNSFYRALASAPKRNEGWNAHCVVLDELHQWTGHHGRELYDALRWADVARSQPMFFQITTAGEDMYSVCREQRDYAMQVNSGRVQDDQFLGYVRTVPDGADPWAEESWHAANPSLGHTITVESFRRDADRARQTPTTIARFLRYRLNVWTTGDSPWIRPADWAACRTDNDVDDLLGRQCYAALDLSRTTDTTSLQLMFPDDDGDGCELLSFFWLPEAKAKQLDGVVPFLQWATEGHITLIPGEVVEYSWIESAFAELCQQYEILTLAYDPLYATDTTARMEEQTGVPRVAFKQSWMNFAGPAKEFERRIISRKIRHHGHPIMDWQIGNATIKSDANGNIRPMKPTANDNRKVDGVVAAVMAQALCIQPEPAPLTYYEEHEVEWA